MQISFKKLDINAVIPTRASVYSAGLDLYALEDGEIGPDIFIARTGIAVEIPDGFEGQVRPRSGLAAKHGITVLNSPGTIDSDYRGEIKIILVNQGDHVFNFKKGDRIAQLVIAPVLIIEPIEVDKLSDTTRGSGGLGSTGN